MLKTRDEVLRNRKLLMPCLPERKNNTTTLPEPPKHQVMQKSRTRTDRGGQVENTKGDLRELGFEGTFFNFLQKLVPYFREKVRLICEGLGCKQMIFLARSGPVGVLKGSVLLKTQHSAKIRKSPYEGVPPPHCRVREGLIDGG